MTPARQEILMQGQTGIAKKVYECVPIQEPWSDFQIICHLQRTTGSKPDVRVFQGCLKSLCDSGLIRQIGANNYQRISVEQKQPAKPAPAVEEEEEVATKETKKSAPLEVLGELANEIVGMAKHLQGLAKRVEDVALAVEQEREMSAKSMEQYRQLKALLKNLQGEGE